jgi:2'-5' RNA ligase
VSEYRLHGSEITVERFHLSICHLGDFKRIPSHIPFAVMRAAQRIAVSAFDIVLDHTVTFPSGRPDKRPTVLLARSPELTVFGERVHRELLAQGLRTDPLRSPHVTLLYGPRSISPHAVRPIRFRAMRFYLIHSELWLTKYNVLGCWPLSDRGPASEQELKVPIAFGSMAA